MHQNRRKSSEKPLRSSLGFWITCCEDFEPFLRAFWEPFAPQSVSRNGKKNRSDFGEVPGGALVDPRDKSSFRMEAGGWPGKGREGDKSPSQGHGRSDEGKGDDGRSDEGKGDEEHLLDARPWAGGFLIYF